MADWQEHLYSPAIHLLSDEYLFTLLSQICSPDTVQPKMNELVSRAYSGLIRSAVNHFFPIAQTKSKTRMHEAHPKEGYYQGKIIDPKTKVTCLALARAGLLPTYVCYHELHYLLPHQNIRQDHISIGRKVDAKGRVVGSEIKDSKIAGDIKDHILLIADPMGATGGTIVEALRKYKKLGKPKLIIALHLIVTPEYLKVVSQEFPELQVLSIRLDRGLSDPAILKTIPGTHWDQEKGLNKFCYIVPGAGGLGEVLNNAFI